MRIIFSIVIWACLSLATSAQKNGIGVSLKALFLDYQSTESAQFEGLSGFDNGLEVGFHYPVTKEWELVIPAKIGLVNFTEGGNSVFVGHLDGQMQYHFYSAKRRANPYIMSGIGIATEEFNNSNIQVPVGLGINVRLKKGTHINVQGSYRFSLDEDRDNVQLGFGIIQYFGEYPDEDTTNVQTIYPDTTDSDRDGIINILDNCPRVPGIAEFGGCPDTDGDGIEDSLDKCPLDAGLAIFKGCPDQDNDGVEDLYDECPDLAGTVANKGCPDNKDKNVADRDGDGVLDDIDRCPDRAGRAEFGGCPDTDGDGVDDTRDDCPNIAGSVSNNGCPENNKTDIEDRDGDGILDDIDRCPDNHGSLDLLGCPDRDGDKVPDRDDRCPDNAGLLQFSGCPDTDGDGIEDSNDDCPEVAGKAENKGCPEEETGRPDDKDGDKILDVIDRCPDRFGLLRHGGCPDSDGDDVSDIDDRCPDEAGSVALNGCPDSDGDGIENGRDRCPFEAGLATNQGCPEIKVQDREVLDFAMRAVQFDHNRSSLKSESFGILDQIVDIMKRYDQYSLSIEGHTDNTGNTSTNQKLSFSRAQRCYDYLIGKGISSSRMTFTGFGETKPISDNDTYNGRSQNRRVEFNLFIR